MASDPRHGYLRRAYDTIARVGKEWKETSDRGARAAERVVNAGIRQKFAGKRAFGCAFADTGEFEGVREWMEAS
eukprot:1346752-Amorphochlora_amoeboformis.AAC.1